MIVTVGTSITRIGFVNTGDVVFNEGITVAYVDTDTATVITAPTSSAMPVNPGSSIAWAGKSGVLYGISKSGSPGVGITPKSTLPFPAPVGGQNYIVTQQGFFFYSATPALGDLIASIAALPGSDQFGNAYKSVLTAYDTATGESVQISGGFIFLNAPGDTAQANIGRASVFNGVDGLQLASPLVPGAGAIQAILTLIASPGTVATIQVSNSVLNIKTDSVPSAPANGFDFYSALQQPAFINQQGFAANLSGFQLADLTLFSVTGTALADTSKAWTIPAGGLAVGSIWELVITGDGTTPTVTTTLRYGGNLAAALGANGTWAANIFPAANTAFRWKLVYRVYGRTTGAAGSYDDEAELWISAFGVSWNPTAPANFSFSGIGGNLGVAINTTVANTIKGQAAWGAAGNGAVINGRRSCFGKVA